MKTISSSLAFFINMTKAQSILTRKFDAGLAGLSLSDFMILYTLSQAKEGKMRRIDLADAIGLTASGITRLLAPMEKVHLVKREQNTDDARVSYVMLGSGGKEKLQTALENAELMAEGFLASTKKKSLDEAMDIVKNLGGKI